MISSPVACPLARITPACARPYPNTGFTSSGTSGGAGSKVANRLRPPFLASYSAWSAAAISSSGQCAHLRRPLRDADRDRNRNIGAGALLGIGAADFQHAAGDHGALAQGRGRQHDAELVAAGARQHVAGPQPRLRHQGEMLQAGVAGGVAVGVVDAFETVEIDHQQRERLAGALRARAFLGQPLHQMAAVADAGEVVEQRQIGDLVAQAIHRHQQEAEIPRHRQEHQHQHHHRLQRRELRVGEPPPMPVTAPTA